MVNWPEAKCLGTSADFLVSERETRRERIAKKICKGCEIRRQCLEFAIQTDSEGVWAGTNYSERQIMQLMMPSLKSSTSDESSHTDKTFQWEPPSVQNKPQDIGYIPTLRLSLPDF